MKNTAEQDLRKTISCLRFVSEIMSEPDFDHIYPNPSLECQRRLGPGWSLMSVMQWLTGKRAVASINALPPSVRFSDLSGAQLIAFHQLALIFCAQHDASEASLRLGIRAMLLPLFNNTAANPN